MLFFYNFIFAKKQAFYIKKAVFFTTDQFVKKQLFYVKMTLFTRTVFYATYIL